MCHLSDGIIGKFLALKNRNRQECPIAERQVMDRKEKEQTYESAALAIVMTADATAGSRSSISLLIESFTRFFGCSMVSAQEYQCRYERLMLSRFKGFRPNPYLS